MQTFNRYKKHIIKIICLAEDFCFNYILISNFDIKNSEITNTLDLTSLIPLKFPSLYVDKYDEFIMKNLIDNSFINSYSKCDNNSKSKIYDFVMPHYCQFFANLNDHLYYLSELNEYISYRYPMQQQYLDDCLNDNENNLKSKTRNFLLGSKTLRDITNPVTTENNNFNPGNESIEINMKTMHSRTGEFEMLSSSNIREEKKKTAKAELNNFLKIQLNNHLIHLIKFDSREDYDFDKEFNNLSIYDQEEYLGEMNNKLLLKENNNNSNNNNFNNNINCNSNPGLGNTYQHSSIENGNNENNNINNTHAIIDSTAMKLSESLSICQKIILLAGYFASELPQKYDVKIFKSVKNTDISKRVCT